MKGSVNATLGSIVALSIPVRGGPTHGRISTMAGSTTCRGRISKAVAVAAAATAVREVGVIEVREDVE